MRLAATLKLIFAIGACVFRSRGALWTISAGGPWIGLRGGTAPAHPLFFGLGTNLGPGLGCSRLLTLFPIFLLLRDAISDFGLRHFSLTQSTSTAG